MIKGSCACGRVRFEIEAARSMTYCHCVNCRKLMGSSVATYVHVEKDKFRWLAGEDNINSYESSPGSVRKFCRTCSSLVPNQAPYLPFVSIAAGLFDDDPGVRPRLHVFTSSKAPWHEITDDLPQHPKWVPGFEPKQN